MLGMDHVRYQQTYDNAPVEGAEFTEHGKNGFLIFSNGKLAHNFPHNCTGAMTEHAAITYLLASVSGNFAWNDQTLESELKVDLNDPSATYYPKGKLIWSLDNFNNLGFNLPGNRFRLGWRFEVYSVNPETHFAYFVDAFTGDVFRKDNLVYEDGPANILTQGSQTIDTEWQGGITPTHVLHANNNGRDITTKFFPNTYVSWGLTSQITDGDDIWGNDEQRGTTAHWMASESWDFFRNVYGLNGMDGSGDEVRVWADMPNFPNAQFIPIGSKNYLKLGTLENAYLAVIDVAGHEFAHGITYHSAGLVYDSEPGALNESFSDIFGFEVEAFAEGAVTDWLMGEDAITLRSLEDPSLFGQPDTYLGANWFTTVGCIPDQFNDWCGVHTNSGVQNYWFFLLSQGGTHNGVTVSGIGHDRAAQIAYFSLTNTMQSVSQYADSRVSSIAAATLLFGACSNEEIQTTNAWAAVGVGNQSNCMITQVRPKTGIEGKIDVFPNPTNGNIILRSFGQKPDEIQIINLSGQIVKSFVGNLEVNTEIEMEDVPSGIYIFKVLRNQNAVNLKVIKQ